MCLKQWEYNYNRSPLVNMLGAVLEHFISYDFLASQQQNEVGNFIPIF